MYEVHVTNQSRSTLTTSNGQQVAPNGGTWSSGTIGDAWVASPTGGTLAFQDIADGHVPGDTAETWGVLISYQGEEIVGRYEGGGRLQVTLNQFHQAALSGMNLRRVFLPPMTIQGEGVAPAEDAAG